MKKKILALTLCVAMLATVAISGTLAYFTDAEAEKNQFVVGDVDIALNEKFDDETPLVPGNPFVEKDVTITNNGESDAYVRLLIAYEDTKDVGAMAKVIVNNPYANDGVVKTDTEDRYVIPGGNGDWLQITDGTTVYTVAYITLSGKVAPDATTESILKGLSINAAADNAWAEIVGEKYDVLVLAQGAQVIEGKTATESINTAFGFTMDAQADANVAKLFTEAMGTTFSAHAYTAEGAWAAQKASDSNTAEWNAVVNDGTPAPDTKGSVTKASDVNP